MSDCVSEHTDTEESIGSNSSQSQSKKKYTSGKRKRKRTIDTDPSSSSSIMPHPDCPALTDKDCKKLALLLQLNRFPNFDDYADVEIEKQMGKEFWDYVTSVYNEGIYNFTRDMVVDMAIKIQNFHQIRKCGCLGRSLSRNLRDRGPPSIPSSQELIWWNKLDEESMSKNKVDEKTIVSFHRVSESDMTCGTSSKKRMHTYNADLAIAQSSGHTQNKAHASSLVSWRTQNKAHASFLASKPVNDSYEIARLIEYYGLPSGIISAMAMQFTGNNVLGSLIVRLNENDLFEWLRKISPDAFVRWHEEWIARNQS